MRYQLDLWICEERLGTASSHYLDLAHLRIASADRSISFSVVDQFEIEMRIALHDIPVANDIILVTPNEVDQYRNIPGTLIRPALLEGKVLYVRA